MPLEGFLPATERWFRETLGDPTPAQALAWPRIRNGEHVLVAAPTGSGKTLAAFLSALDELFRRGLAGELEDRVAVLYLSPLKALGNDVEKNLAAPLEGISRMLRVEGEEPPRIRTAVRTGDTPAKERTTISKRPPHVYVTTPESLYLLLTSESGRSMLRHVRTVIVDEIHALVDDRRGAHLALSLERLEQLVGAPIQRIGLSATQRPIDEVARFLVGGRGLSPEGEPRCAIVDAGHLRALELGLELPRSPLETVMSNEVWEEISDRIAELVRAHRTTLVFVNSRRTAERTARRLSDRLGDEAVGSHHGSLSKETRLVAEKKLKAGELRVVVATASLELGIDVGDVDLVVQVGSPGAISTFLQRLGRSGHGVGRIPRARLFPLSRDELVEAIGLFDAVARGELETLRVPVGGLDILAQQIVAAASIEPLGVDALYELFRSAHPYRDLARETFDGVITMLAEGFATERGRRGALLHHDAVNGVVRGRRGARIAALTGGGAIPDTFDFDVRLEPEGLRIGTVHEDFAIESMAGDVFQLGNASYRILKIEGGLLRVADARGEPPSMPFWIAEAPGRSDALSHAVSTIRREVERLLPDGEARAEAALAAIPGVSGEAAREAVTYLAAGYRALGTMPTEDTVVLERFFDEAGSQHLVVHAPFGSRRNRAWGLALRKRFCRSFNVELQAAATDDAFVLSLGPMHAMPLDDVFGYLRSDSARDVLIQALLDAPMFGTRFRWNATRALAVPRRLGGKRTPPRIQRVLSDDLLAVSFPDQVACLENLSGPRDIPDHPLVRQTIDDCLDEAMDAAGMTGILRGLERGAIRGLVRETTEPSPFSHGILNPRPYAFLDDAPLEERRTLAIRMRRTLDVASAGDLAALDADAIARVREECAPEPRDEDELHDQLLSATALPEQELVGPRPFLEALVRAGRALRVHTARATLVVPRERLALALAAHPTARREPLLEPLDGMRPSHEEGVRELVRGRLDRVGPTSPARIAEALDLLHEDVVASLAGLEAEGIALRGSFTPGETGIEYCERGLLARIHRYTLDRLRRAIEPVEAAVYLRFLLRFHGLEPGDRRRGVEGLAAVLERLEGFDAPAQAFEQDLLPARVEGYEPGMLDLLCLTGRFAWFRRVPPQNPRPGASPIRSMPVAIAERASLDAFRVPGATREDLSPDAEAVLAALERDGASFVHELARRAGVLPSRTEDALAELAHRGLATADSFAGLRAFLLPAKRPRPGRKDLPTPIASAGRWSALAEPSGADVDRVALALLRRYGVVFRRILDREDALPPWRELLRVYRRLEARGEIRGGRFIAGFGGEQYALPEVIPALRAARSDERTGSLVSVSAADPTNLVGLVTPDGRVASTATNRILFRDGVPVAVLEGGEVRHLPTAGSTPLRAFELALVRHASSRPTLSGIAP